ncbi:MAG TPA: PAS domain-containing protein [Opitutaceae bacterium]|nr:PAS domain-containing protein [Opitutaceae bacterium]
MLFLDASGRIVAANSSARALWQAADAELVGEHFAGLFAFEVVSNEPDWLEAQWDVLLAAALEQPIPLKAQPREGAPCEVRVRLEKSLSTAPGYFAVVDLPGTASAEAAPAAAHAKSDGPAVLAEKGSAGFFDLNFKENRIHYSPAWKKILGYVDAELPNTYETWLKLIHPDDSGAAPDKLGKKQGPGTRPFTIEFRMKHRLGHDVWIQSVGLQIVGADGALERVIGTHLDITERKELEEASLANDDRFQALSDEAGPLGAFEIDFAQQRYWFSAAWKKLLGYTDEELANGPDTLLAVLPAEEVEAGVQAYFLGRATGQTAFVETVRLKHKDGNPRTLLLGVHRSLTRKRELTRVVGFCSALPEADAAGAATSGDALSSPLTTAALATVAEGVLVTDGQGKVLQLNPAAARLLNVTAEKARGQAVADIFRIVNRQSGRPGDDPVDRALSAEKDLPLISEDALAPAAEGGEPTPIAWTARAAVDANGRPVGVIIVFRDPEEMRLTPEELVKANRFESLGLLAGGIAHDFNNLLTTILGGVSIAKDSRDYSALEDAEKACLTAKGLTKQLLAFAKGGAGTQIVAAVKEILDDTVKIAAAGSTAEVKVEVADGVEPVLVDRAQILQVFQNLVVNALQAMPPAPHQARVQLIAANVTLAADQIPSLPAGKYVQFESRDNGSGIKPEYLEKIWDPFFTTKKHGTGLGLATVLSIVRKHGGIIGVESTLGVGTTFTIFLPAADRPVEVQARRAASLRFGTGRVLFMDDDPKITALTSSMLQSLDYKFDAAKNGEEAIALYQRYLNIGRPYDAVIMDLTVIGGMGGEECFHALKKLDPDVRAIVSSGYDNDDMARKFLDLGFCGYLTKPYRVTDLGKVLKAVLG